MDGHVSPTLWGSTWHYITLSPVCGRIDVKQKNTRDSWLISMNLATVLTSQDDLGQSLAGMPNKLLQDVRFCNINHGCQLWTALGPGPTKKKNGGHPHWQKTPTIALAGSIQNHNKQLLRWRSKVLRTSFANTNQLPNTPSHFPTKHGGGSFELIFHPSSEVQYAYSPTSTTKSVNDTEVNAVWMRSGSWGQPGKHFLLESHAFVTDGLVATCWKYIKH